MHVDVGAQGFSVANLGIHGYGSKKKSIGEVFDFRSGDDFSALHVSLMEHCIAEIRKDRPEDAALAADDPRTLRRLRQHSMTAIQHMSTGAEVTIEIPDLLPDYCFSRTLSKDFPESFFAKQIKAVADAVRSILWNSGHWNEAPPDYAQSLCEVVMTGDGVRIPGLKKALQKVVNEFGTEHGREEGSVRFLHHSSSDALVEGCALLSAFFQCRGQEQLICWDMLMWAVCRDLGNGLWRNKTSSPVKIFCFETLMTIYRRVAEEDHAHTYERRKNKLQYPHRLLVFR